MNRRPLLALFPVLLLAGTANAFTEDICYESASIVDCTPLPAACQPAGTDSVACRDAAILVFAQGAKDPARSTVHVDAPFLMAQVIGFSFEDAYWIAAYSEATDQGSFEPRDNTGALYGGGAYKTASLTGLERTDFTPSGGVFIHFSAPRNPNGPQAVAGIDGLDPDPTDATHEVMIAHLRQWAMAGSGTAKPDCAVGLTNPSASGDDATGNTCYSSAGVPATVNGSVTLFDGAAQAAQQDNQDFTVQTGLQIIQDDGNGTTATSDTFDSVVGAVDGHVADARLAVYIHAYGDRISHHVCLDKSYLYGPTDGGSTWTANMTNNQCAQGIHCLRHIWETGVDFSLLDAENRTSTAYLTHLYGELVTFATARGVLASGATDPNVQSKLIDDLSTALETPGASARLDALHQITCDRGLTPFPGQPACPASPTATSSSNTATSTGGSSTTSAAGGSPVSTTSSSTGAGGGGGSGSKVSDPGDGCSCDLAPVGPRSNDNALAIFGVAAALVLSRRRPRQTCPSSIR